MASSLGKIRTLKARADFLRLIKSKDRVYLQDWLAAKFIKSENGLGVGWTLPKAIGTAVLRNRLRRWIREYLRKNECWLNELDFEVNIVFRKPRNGSLKDLLHEDLDFELEKLFRKLQKRK